jgi:hypothetical protein
MSCSGRVGRVGIYADMYFLPIAGRTLREAFSKAACRAR